METYHFIFDSQVHKLNYISQYHRHLPILTDFTPMISYTSGISGERYQISLGSETLPGKLQTNDIFLRVLSTFPTPTSSAISFTRTKARKSNLLRYFSQIQRDL